MDVADGQLELARHGLVSRRRGAGLDELAVERLVKAMVLLAGPAPSAADGALPTRLRGSGARSSLPAFQ